MINKDNNLNIDILRQQNANIPLKEASSQSEEPHQLGNSESRVIFITAPVRIIILALCSRKMLRNYQL
ncbi:hypothetical protein CMV63_12515 [Escherichia coli]|nr:hypothetical protein CMV63_12515 [Escherichia coli]RJK28224.1 hypothetical protein CMV45_09660 [Escherichia coli]